MKGRLVVRQFQERQCYTETYDMLFEIVFKAFFGLKFSTTTHKRGCCVWEERQTSEGCNCWWLFNEVVNGSLLVRLLSE